MCVNAGLRQGYKVELLETNRGDESAKVYTYPVEARLVHEAPYSSGARDKAYVTGWAVLVAWAACAVAALGVKSHGGDCL